MTDTNGTWFVCPSCVLGFQNGTHFCPSPTTTYATSTWNGPICTTCGTGHLHGTPCNTKVMREFAERLLRDADRMDAERDQ